MVKKGEFPGLIVTELPNPVLKEKRRTCNDLRRAMGTLNGSTNQGRLVSKVALCRKTWQPNNDNLDLQGAAVANAGDRQEESNATQPTQGK